MKLTQNEIALLINKDIQSAAAQYIARKDRTEHPDGEFDNAGRWYPDETEKLNTDMYRSPSRAYKYSYMLACRTVEHVANLHGFTNKDELLAIKRVAKIMKSDLSIEEYISIHS